MKISPRDIKGILDRPKPQYIIFLLYGSDSGLMAERAKLLTAQFHTSQDDPLALTLLSSEQIASEQSLLVDSLNAVPMFGGRRVVVLSGQADGLKDAVSHASATMDKEARLIIRAHNVNTLHPLVKFCDSADNCASIGCYPDDSRSVSQLAGEIFNSYQITAETDAMNIIQSRLGADRQASRMELEKLCLFVGKGGRLTADDTDKLLGDNAALQTDLLSAAILSGNVVQFNAHFSRIRREAIQPIAIIRQLMGLLRAMQLVYLPTGGVDISKLSDIRPRLHFKIKPVIEQQVTRWPQKAVDDAITKLVSLEINLKSGQGGNPLTITGQILLGICLRAQAFSRF